MESHEQDIHIKGTKLITNSKSLRNGFRFFHVIFILDTLNKRLSWDHQNSVRVVGGWLHRETWLHPVTGYTGYCIMTKIYLEMTLNHKLNSLQQWLNWLKNMFWMFLSSGPHGPEPGWSATRDLQSTSLGQRRGYQIRTEVPSWLYTGMELPQITTSMFNLKVMWSLKLFFPWPVGCEDRVALKPTNAFGCTWLHIRELTLFVVCLFLQKLPQMFKTPTHLG